MAKAVLIKAIIFVTLIVKSWVTNKKIAFFLPLRGLGDVLIAWRYNLTFDG